MVTSSKKHDEISLIAHPSWRQGKILSLFLSHRDKVIETSSKKQNQISFTTPLSQCYGHRDKIKETRSKEQNQISLTTHLLCMETWSKKKDQISFIVSMS